MGFGVRGSGFGVLDVKSAKRFFSYATKDSRSCVSKPAATSYDPARDAGDSYKPNPKQF